MNTYEITFNGFLEDTHYGVTSREWRQYQTRRLEAHTAADALTCFAVESARIEDFELVSIRCVEAVKP